MKDRGQKIIFDKKFAETADNKALLYNVLEYLFNQLKVGNDPSPISPNDSEINAEGGGSK